MFHQFDEDNDGILSEQDILVSLDFVPCIGLVLRRYRTICLRTRTSIEVLNLLTECSLFISTDLSLVTQAIFAIIPEPSLPPWHPSRSREVFSATFSLPKFPFGDNGENDSLPTSILSDSHSFNADGITISSTDPLILPGDETIHTVDPSVLSQRRIHPPFSLLDWMSYWHMSSVISPSSTRAELYRLGHVENPSSGDKPKRGRRKAAVTPSTDPSLPISATIRARVFGSRGCGKSALLNALCQSDVDPNGHGKSLLTTEETLTPLTSCAHVQFTSSAYASRSKKTQSDVQNSVVHVIFTEVPEKTVEMERPDVLTRDCDLVVLTFDCSDRSSLTYAIGLEDRLLYDETPRVFIGMRADKGLDSESNAEGMSLPDKDLERHAEASILDIAKLHCSSLDIEPPLLTTVDSKRLSVEPDGGSYSFVLKHLIKCTPMSNLSTALRDIPKLKSIPHAFEKRRQQDVKKKRIIWIGGVFGVGIVVLVGTALWPKKEKNSWLKSWWPIRFSLKEQ